MGMGSRGGGWDVFGCGHLVWRVSPCFLVKMDKEAINFWAGEAVSRICFCCRSLNLWWLAEPFSLWISNRKLKSPISRRVHHSTV